MDYTHDNKDNTTFIVQVKKRENHSCQGIVKWVEKGKTVPFRSSLELLRLIDSTMESEN